jgi:predicted type IV restriction endonuclease
MDLEAALGELSKRVKEHRDVLLTEEAAKTALVMPFLQALGYNVFNPAEVVPEFTCDVGTKKGEKVDYAICNGGKVEMLIECKPANSELSINHASQLFRYFSVTAARVAVLTNGVIYKFFSDVEMPNVMDQKPFFVLDLESTKKQDVRTLSGFAKGTFDIDQIVKEAGKLKLQSLLHIELQKEFAEPSDELVRLIGKRVHSGMITASLKETFKALIVNSFQTLVRESVNERLTSALSATNTTEEVQPVTEGDEDGRIETTEDEVTGYNIIRAIAAQKVDIGRIVMRDSKSYCAILLDDNRLKTVARLWFNSPKSRYLGTFKGKEETRASVEGPTDIYKHSKAILARIQELTEGDQS